MQLGSILGLVMFVYTSLPYIIGRLLVDRPPAFEHLEHLAYLQGCTRTHFYRGRGHLSQGSLGQTVRLKARSRSAALTYPLFLMLFDSRC